MIERGGPMDAVPEADETRGEMSEGEAGQRRPFKLVRGGVPESPQKRCQRRWRRPQRRTRTCASARRRLRWTRSPAKERPARDAREHCREQSRRARRRRHRSPPWRLLQKEVLATISRTKSRAEYDELVDRHKEVFLELLEQWRREVFLMKPADLVGGWENLGGPCPPE